MLTKQAEPGGTRNRTRWAGPDRGLWKKQLSGILFLLLLLSSMWYVKLDPVEFVLGIPTFIRFLLVDFFPPNLSDLPLYVKPILDTLAYSVLATCVSSVAGLAVALLMARNTSPHPVWRSLSRGVVSFFRNIPFLVWASLLVVIFGVGSVAGVTALIVFGTGFLARVYAESMEEINRDSLEALEACGATYGQILKHGIFPAFMPGFYSWTLFMFEINIRASAILGLVGAGGIGSLMKQTIDLFQYGKTSAVITLLICMILLVEFVTNRIRRRLI